MDEFPSYEELIAEAAELQLPSFTYDDAWALGLRLVELARADALPVAIDVRKGRQQVFHAGLPGSSADNDAWIRRKVRVVERYGEASLAVGQLWRERGTTFEQASRLDPARFAAAGGCVPVVVRGVGPVGTAAVSGLPQVEDHRLVVRALRAHLAAAGRPLTAQRRDTSSRMRASEAAESVPVSTTSSPIGPRYPKSSRASRKPGQSMPPVPGAPRPGASATST